MRILVADVGATKTILAVATLDGADIGLENVQRRPTPREALEPLLRDFQREIETPVDCVVLGVPGPVRDGHCKATNLPWEIDEGALRAHLDVPCARLINDLEAVAWGLDDLHEEQLHVLNPGEPRAVGHRAVIAPGTGLGEAGLYWDGARHHPFATEGGHTDFAPGTALHTRLQDYIRGRFGHASWERVLSGRGLVNLYEFMLADRGLPAPDWFVAARDGADPAPAVSRAGLERRCPVAADTLRLFAGLLGAETGNLALKLNAQGGVYVGGGIAPHVLPVLEAGDFQQAFRSKGRMSHLLERIPVRVILEPATPLYGAARYGQRMMQSPPSH
jgi:glucokinase